MKEGYAGFLNNTDYYDQHFLVDENVLMKFVESAKLKKNEVVIEVGPGKGVISKMISPLVKKLYCVELDTRLKPYLDCIGSNVEVLYENVLKAELPKCDKLVTSLPYSIVEPFLKRMVNEEVKELFLITGSRYANNVVNNSLTKLSLMTNVFYYALKIDDINPCSFYPKPRVMSSMIKLVKKDLSEIDDLKLLVYRYLFLYEGMKLKNSLRESLIQIKGFTKKESKKLVSDLKIDSLLLEKKFVEISNDELGYLDELLNNL